jgi:hypothetical protein
MIPVIKKMVFMNRVQRILNQHQITILHYIPGRIRLKSPQWKKDTGIINRLVDEIKKEGHNCSVSFSKETGSLLFTYDATPVNDVNKIEAWFEFLNKVCNESAAEERRR